MSQFSERRQSAERKLSPMRAIYITNLENRSGDEDKLLSDVVSLKNDPQRRVSLHDMGYTLGWGSRSGTEDFYNHVGPPEEWSFETPTQYRLMTPASSEQASGVNVLLADGSVSFYSNGVDIRAWRAIGTIGAGD